MSIFTNTDDRRKASLPEASRAEHEAATRLRITESAVELHGSLGPARTSISAVAEHAGVQRSTVYRHFPDEAAAVRGCSSHWAREPAARPSVWAAIDDPDGARGARRALRLLRPHRRDAEKILRDEALVPLVAQTFRLFRDYVSGIQADLVRDRRLRGTRRRRVQAAVGHALDFTTWRSLVRDHGLDDADAVALMCGLVQAAAAPPRPLTSSSARRSPS